MNEETTTQTTEPEASQETKKGGVPNQGALYTKISARYQEILDALFKGLSSSNDNVRIGAAKTLLNKILPDLKSIEVGGALQEDGTRRAIELFVNVGGGFIPTTVSLYAPSTSTASTIPPTVQSTNLAPQGQENLHSDNGDSQTSASA